jgi:thioredoxin-related protein
MQKKAILVLSSLLSLFFVQGCRKDSLSTDSKGRILLSKKEGMAKPVEIDSASNLARICRYDPALVLVTKEGCSYCEKAVEDLSAFIKETSALVYTIDHLPYREAVESTDNKSGTYKGLFPSLTYTPTFLFYAEGKLVNEKEGGFSDLATGLREYVSTTEYYSLNDYTEKEDSATYSLDVDEDTDLPGRGTSFLEQKIKSKEDFTVLFSYRCCPDCAEYKELVLTPYRKDHPDTRLFYYEMEGFYALKSMDGEEGTRGRKLFSDFALSFHLADYDLTDKDGNRTGVVPTLVSYRNGSYSISVFRNDVGYKENSDGSLSYAKSFYPEVLELSSSTKGDSDEARKKEREELKDLALPIETGKSISFLEENL